MNEIRLRNLQQGEDITDFIPEIIQAFEQQEADVVHFTGLNSEHFQVNLFDFNVYSSITSPELRKAYMNMLIYKQACKSYNDPQSFALTLESFYNSVENNAVTDYLSHFVKNIGFC